jgi:hypothetical protein
VLDEGIRAAPVIHKEFGDSISDLTIANKFGFVLFCEAVCLILDMKQQRVGGDPLLVAYGFGVSKPP